MTIKNKLATFILLLTPFAFEAQDSNYVFGWSHLEDTELILPRGGSTQGPPVTLDDTPSQAWLDLQNPKLNKFEKDRQAILAMQGRYRVNFDFMETMGFVAEYQPQRPYQSWGTEFVIAIEDRDDFISLQHIMVMYFELEDGSVSEPIVVKHWRQDWQYQDASLHTYSGNDTWNKKFVSWSQRKGTWSQAVYQVDDSPRYQGFGAWKHYDGFSSWTSNETWRPLPRREATTRDDYDVMIGTNIQTITPDGWVHEQNNKKVVLAETNAVLAKEIGLARYQRIIEFDWQAGDSFWKNTEPFWREVRSQWDRKLNKSQTFELIKTVDNQNLFMRLFALSNAYEEGSTEAIDYASIIVEEHSRTIP